MFIEIPRIYAEVVATRIIATDTDKFPVYADVDALCAFASMVENTRRLEIAISKSGTRQIGMQAVPAKAVESFHISSDLALSLAYFMENTSGKTR